MGNKCTVFWKMYSWKLHYIQAVLYSVFLSFNIGPIIF